MLKVLLWMTANISDHYNYKSPHLYFEFLFTQFNRMHFFEDLHPIFFTFLWTHFLDAVVYSFASDFFNFCGHIFWMQILAEFYIFFTFLANAADGTIFPVSYTTNGFHPCTVYSQ